LLEDALELVQLMHDVDVTWMDVEEQFLGLVEVGVETCTSLLGPVWRKRQTVHHASQPVELNAFFVDIKEKSIFEYIFRSTFQVLSRVDNDGRDISKIS
jgi:hypothetical protein